MEHNRSPKELIMPIRWIITVLTLAFAEEIERARTIELPHYYPIARTTL